MVLSPKKKRKCRAGDKEKQCKEGDTVYVYYGSTPAYLYYPPLYNLDSGDVQVQPDELRKKVALQGFFEGVEGLAGRDRVWFLFSDIVDCGGCDGDILAYFEGSLNEYGTLLDKVRAPGDAGGFSYDLNP